MWYCLHSFECSAMTVELHLILTQAGTEMFLVASEIP